MPYHIIHKKTVQLKNHILLLLEKLMEPAEWEKLQQSSLPSLRHQFIIYDHDYPTIRDTKALLNMLSSIERATMSYPFRVLSLFSTIELPLVYADFQRNYRLFMSTNTLLTKYLEMAQEYTLTTIIPKILEWSEIAIAALTMENIEKSADFLVDKIIVLEQYQDRYAEKLRSDPSEENKSEQNQDHLMKLIYHNEIYLKKIYGEKFKEYFIFEQNDQKHLLNYYQDTPNDTKTVRHLKNLLNGMIGIKKVILDYSAYSQSTFLTSVTWVVSFYWDLRRAFASLTSFDYQAIIAEHSKPLADFIKQQLTHLNDSLEILACSIDHLENDMCFKEGILLQHVKSLMQRFNKIAHELQMPVDYVRQKRIYLTARIKAREKYLAEVDIQIDILKKILPFKEDALIDIPQDIINLTREYIGKHSDSISANREHIALYQKYLIATQRISKNTLVSMAGKIETIANSFGFTIHAEIMRDFQCRLLYFMRKKAFLTDRLHRLKKSHDEHPFEFFAEKNYPQNDCTAVILHALRERSHQIHTQKEALMTKIAEQKPQEKLPFMPSQKSNRLMLLTREHGLFENAISAYENNHPQAFEALKNDTGISAETILLVDEAEKVLQNSLVRIA